MSVTEVPAVGRLTPQRRAVLDVLTAAGDHPTAAEVYDRVRRRSPGIGAATVYRALALLVAGGAALELNLGDQAARFDANTERHDHLVCDSCGRVVDIDVPMPAHLTAQVADQTGFAVTSYDLQLRGLCPACRTNPTHPREDRHVQAGRHQDPPEPQRGLRR